MHLAALISKMLESAPNQELAEALINQGLLNAMSKNYSDLIEIPDSPE